MRMLKLAPVAAMVLLAACASKPKPGLGGADGGAVPSGQAQGPGAGGGGPVGTGGLSSLAEQFAAEAGNRIYFALDSYGVDADARSTLQGQANWLVAHPGVRVLVAGNADERGTREYNLALGARRATAVKDLLVSWGVAAHRIDTISYGKERPIAPGSSEEAWAQNRNAHSVVLEFGDRR